MKEKRTSTGHKMRGQSTACQQIKSRSLVTMILVQPFAASSLRSGSLCVCGGEEGPAPGTGGRGVWSAVRDRRQEERSGGGSGRGCGQRRRGADESRPGDRGPTGQRISLLIEQESKEGQLSQAFDERHGVPTVLSSLLWAMHHHVLTAINDPGSERAAHTFTNTDRSRQAFLVRMHAK